MKIYHVYYEGVHIGELYCEGDKQKYIVNHENIQELIKQGEPINPVLMKDKEEFGEAIPYFKVRLDSNERFRDIEIGFITDKVRIRE